jgi:hypothetical protein
MTTTSIKDTSHLRSKLDGFTTIVELVSMLGIKLVQKIAVRNLGHVLVSEIFYEVIDNWLRSEHQVKFTSKNLEEAFTEFQKIIDSL